MHKELRPYNHNKERHTSNASQYIGLTESGPTLSRLGSVLLAILSAGTLPANTRATAVYLALIFSDGGLSEDDI